MDDPRIPPLLSVTQTAAELGITRQAVLKSAAAGRIAGRQVGTTWVFRADLIAEIKGQKQGSAGPVD